MDGDKFGDPRTRSQRGRARGRRGRGTRGGPAARGRGRGAHRNKSIVVEQQPHPEAIASAAGDPHIESNAYRFEQYDALRSSARRDGVKQDVDFYSMPDNYDDDDDGDDVDDDRQDSQNGAGESLDVHVADAGNDEEGNEVDAMNLVADFSRLATVLTSAPLWARLGSAGQFALNSETLTLDQLVSDSGEDDNERDEHDNDMNDMMKELDMVDIDHDVDDQHDQDNADKKEIIRTDPAQSTTPLVNEQQDGSDDEFDKWLDNA